MKLLHEESDEKRSPRRDRVRGGGSIQELRSFVKYLIQRDALQVKLLLHLTLPRLTPWTIRMPCTELR